MEITLVGTKADMSGLGLDDRQRGKRSGLPLDLTVGELFDVVRINSGRALEQSGVQVEDITGVCLTSRRPPQQQGDLAVSPSLFGEVVVNDQRVLASIAEVLAHRATGVGCNELHRRRV
jgi:hypothetical protein